MFTLSGLQTIWHKLLSSLRYINEMGVYAEYDHEYVPPQPAPMHLPVVFNGAMGVAAASLLLAAQRPGYATASSLALIASSLPLVSAEPSYLNFYPDTVIESMHRFNDSSWLASSRMTGESVEANMPALLLFDSSGMPILRHSIEFVNGELTFNEAQMIPYVSESEFILSCNMQFDGASNGEALVMRIRYPQEVIWSKSFANLNFRGGASIPEQTLSVANNGDIVLLAKSNDVPFPMSIVRIDADGELIWIKGFQLPGNSENLIAHSVQALESGYIALGGKTANAPNAVWLAVLDAHGELIWSSTIGDGFSQSMQVFMVSRSASPDRFWVAGKFAPGSAMYFVAQYHVNGDQLVLNSLHNNLNFASNYLFIQEMGNSLFFAGVNSVGDSNVVFAAELNLQLELVAASTITSTEQVSGDANQYAEFQVDDSGFWLAHRRRLSGGFVLHANFDANTTLDCPLPEANVVMVPDVLGAYFSTSLTVEPYQATTQANNRTAFLFSRSLPNVEIICSEIPVPTVDSQSDSGAIPTPPEQTVPPLLSSDSSSFPLNTVLITSLLGGCAGIGCIALTAILLRRQFRNKQREEGLPLHQAFITALAEDAITCSKKLGQSECHASYLGVRKADGKDIVVRRYKNNFSTAGWQDSMQLLQTIKSSYCLSMQFYQWKNLPVIITQYQPLGSLAQWTVQREPMTSELLLAFSKDIIEGVAFLHRNNIVHGALHAQNVLRVSEKSLCLTDYGLGTLSNKSVARVEDIGNLGNLLNALLVLAALQPAFLQLPYASALINLVARCQNENVKQRPAIEKVQLEFHELIRSGPATLEINSDSGQPLQSLLSQHLLFSTKEDSVAYLSNFATQPISANTGGISL